jgi:hypothetical protein
VKLEAVLKGWSDRKPFSVTGHGIISRIPKPVRKTKANVGSGGQKGKGWTLGKENTQAYARLMVLLSNESWGLR